MDTESLINKAKDYAAQLIALSGQIQALEQTYKEVRRDLDELDKQIKQEMKNLLDQTYPNNNVRVVYYEFDFPKDELPSYDVTLTLSVESKTE